MTGKKCTPTLVLITLVLQSAPLVRAENWPVWRGPRGDGHSSETNVPVRWSATENVEWKVELPGWGHSSPVVWDDRIYLTAAVEQSKERQLLCVSRRDGRRLWKTTVLKAELERRHRLNSFASATPATNGQYIYVTFLSGNDLVAGCYDPSGKRVWHRTVGPFRSMHGFCSTPVIYKHLLLINGDHDGDAYLVALNRHTGETAWKVARHKKVRSYCPPSVIRVDGRDQMVLSGSDFVTGYDPLTGRRIWYVNGPTEQMVASVVYRHGLVFVTGGFPELHLLAIDPTGRGNVTDTHVRWRDTRGVAYVPSPIAAGDWFFVISDRGFASCFEACTGERKWIHRLGGAHSASIVAADDRLYFLSDEGVTTVVEVADTYKQVAQNAIGQPTIASPAISNGQIFIRSREHLFCIGKHKETSG